ncbi:MAG TPA: polyphosphate kinase 2 family protein [Bryobacteraceae bacterium]|jgi:PPK2 family polyphosphate:nucleotide phosphotransferase|nr:polyphosphate kinase 2 family protein [Bryobacteraceae bacterium]
MAMDIGKLRAEPGARFRLAKFAAEDTHGVSKEHAADTHRKHVEWLAALHDLLYGEHKRSLLIILQGMDASGKDGTIKHVMSGVNPQGCTVTSFKQPSATELDHDFLWRVHAAVPPKGSIGIFNRSHYEDVLVTRVHDLVPVAVWKKRYRQVNEFERMLAENNVHILKFFLHMSKREQGKRFDERLRDPDKNWKSSPADFREREYWDQYHSAYEDAIERCGTKEAPWYVIPSDHKWFRNFAVAEIVVRTMESFRMKYPKRTEEAAGVGHGGTSAARK